MRSIFRGEITFAILPPPYSGLPSTDVSRQPVATTMWSTSTLINSSSWS